MSLHTLTMISPRAWVMYPPSSWTRKWLVEEEMWMRMAGKEVALAGIAHPIIPFYAVGY
jgi:hypothetical protein